MRAGREWRLEGRWLALPEKESELVSPCCRAELRVVTDMRRANRFVCVNVWILVQDAKEGN
jgi:hypothetical protein